MGVLRIMNARRGDVAVAWTVGDARSEEKARKAFEEAKQLGFVAFALDPDGKHGQVIPKFDPGAELIVATPRIAGG